MAALFSIRMRASRLGEHLSGAERLVRTEAVESICLELLRRGRGHSRGEADAVRLAIDLVDEAEVVTVSLPDLLTWQVADVDAGRRAALSRLVAAGVPEPVAGKAMRRLAEGAAPGGGVMRGAMLVDVRTGERLEADRARGVRVSRMDLLPETAAELSRRLAVHDLDNRHVREALVLAAKVISAPGVVAELCWSDDPDYTAGYVAAPIFGYQRFPRLKPAGDRRGGRAFFVDRRRGDVAELVRYLERTPVLAIRPGRVSPARPWQEE